MRWGVALYRLERLKSILQNRYGRHKRQCDCFVTAQRGVCQIWTERGRDFIHLEGKGPTSVRPEAVKVT